MMASVIDRRCLMRGEWRESALSLSVWNCFGRPQGSRKHVLTLLIDGENPDETESRRQSGSLRRDRSRPNPSAR